MISLAPGTKVFSPASRLICGPGSTGWRPRCSRSSAPIRSAAMSSSSAANAASDRHSAYGFEFATIAYRWHPLFGRTFRVSPFRRGKELTCIYTDERPDLCRELPNWMFDQGYCAGMTLGPPEISIEGLIELAAVLALFDRDQNRSAQSALRSRRRRAVRDRRYQGREQLVLELQRHDQPALTTNATGLVEALADLLLAALGMDIGTTAATGGGVDERQDHAWSSRSRRRRVCAAIDDGSGHRQSRKPAPTIRSRWDRGSGGVRLRDGD